MFSGTLQKQILKSSSRFSNTKHRLTSSPYFNRSHMMFSTAFTGVKIPYNSNLQGMIEWYQKNGHTLAQTDPLGLKT